MNGTEKMKKQGIDQQLIDNQIVSLPVYLSIYLSQVTLLYLKKCFIPTAPEHFPAREKSLCFPEGLHRPRLFPRAALQNNKSCGAGSGKSEEAISLYNKPNNNKMK
ncbi:MAG: hypothetical protein LBR48_01915, partial [Dysgonamonadaceae bacterium]|nr:hypothetical protein [Dysgonamonadaceae bacterium]